MPFPALGRAIRPSSLLGINGAWLGELRKMPQKDECLSIKSLIDPSSFDAPLHQEFLDTSFVGEAILAYGLV